MINGDQPAFLAAAERLFGTETVGFVALDADQRVAATRGNIVDWIKPKAPAADAMPFLVGYEDRLALVSSGELSSFRLPYIALNGHEVPPSKAMSIEVFRLDSEGGVGLLVHDETGRYALERDLLQHRNELALAQQERQRLTDIIRTYKDELDRQEFEGFIGSSLKMQAVYRIIESAASSDATVFVSGESGTGKEVCAEAIHRLSGRKDGPFVPVNCAAIPKDLIESELFGHVKGAFTGAVSNRAGAATLADGGTLFLDEICEMDVDIQSKLLRFLQTRKIQRVGKSQPEDVDVRIVCATNKDAMAEVEAGRFREDLYYRLHVIPIELPPLRDRDADVIQLSEAFLRQTSEKEGKRLASLSPEAREIFLDYRWPGNVRELQNIIQRIVVLNDADVVTPDMVPTPLLAPPTPEAGPAARLTEPGREEQVPAIHTPVAPDDPGVEPLAEVERKAIQRAIDRCGGNVRLAASRLGIAPATIYRKLAAWRDSSSQLN